MSKLSQLLLAVMLFAQGNEVRASDLELSIRTHAREVTFGDPLYVEVTIVNRGKEAVSALPTYHSDRFRFEIRNADTHLVMWKIDAEGERSPLEFAPGKPNTFHQFLFVPGARLFNHPFWAPNRQREEFYYICGVYRLNDAGDELRSKWQDLLVHARNDAELRSLERWAWAEVQTSGKEPAPNHFGLHFLRPLGHRQTLQIASQIQPGEIANVLEVTMRLQELYATPPELRAAGDDTLIEWLRKQPEIKRQALTKKTRNLTESYNMPSTMNAIQTLLDNP